LLGVGLLARLLGRLAQLLSLRLLVLLSTPLRGLGLLVLLLGQLLARAAGLLVGRLLTCRTAGLLVGRLLTRRAASLHVGRLLAYLSPALLLFLLGMCRLSSALILEIHGIPSSTRGPVSDLHAHSTLSNRGE